MKRKIGSSNLRNHMIARTRWDRVYHIHKTLTSFQFLHSTSLFNLLIDVHLQSAWGLQAMPKSPSTILSLWKASNPQAGSKQPLSLTTSWAEMALHNNAARPPHSSRFSSSYSFEWNASRRLGPSHCIPNLPSLLAWSHGHRVAMVLRRT